MSYCEKLMKMSLAELKKEYYNCDSDDNAQKDVIRQIALKKKSMLNKQKIEANLKTILKSKESTNDNTLVQKRGKNEKHWEMHQNKIESHYKEEIKKDFTNNKLMERLNCEVDFRINGNRKKEIEKPYDDHEEEEIEENYKRSARRLIH